MTHQYIKEVLESKDEFPILLDDCVLNIRKNRNIIYSLFGETDYIVREIEICYADNPNDIIFKGEVKTQEDLKGFILDTLNLK